jgi:hypothetical protein
MLPVPASARALRSPMVMVLPVLGRATSVARSGTDFARAHGRSTPVAIDDPTEPAPPDHTLGR